MSDEYGLERHREAHERAVAAWRERVDERLRERVTLPADWENGDSDADGSHEVTVSYLG